MKKILILLLAVAMIFSVIACAKNDKDDGKNTGDKPPVNDPDNTTENLDDPTHLPEISFDGAEFRIHTKEGTSRDEVYADETATDIRQQALWERNAAVEDQYDIVITPVLSYDGTVSGQVNEIMDGLLGDEDFYDIALTYAVGTGPLVTGGFCVNWENLDYTDLSKRYWIYDVNKNFMFDDAIYTVVGDMCTTTLTYTYAMFYNRTEGDKIKDENGESLTNVIFDKIDNNEWTLDYFSNLVSDKYDDIDDTPGKSLGDFYGFTAEAATNLDIWPFALNIPIITLDEVEMIKIVFNNEKTITAADKINNLYWENPGSLIGVKHPEETGIPTSTFKAGNALFCTSYLAQCYSNFAAMEEHYTVLPYPMYDEDQENYMTGAMDNYSIITIPYNAPDLEMVSIITEALNYESSERVFPVFYEESLQKQHARDPETIEMLDVIMDGRTFDLATTLVPALAQSFRASIASKENDFAKYFDEQAESFAYSIENLIEQYEINKMVGRD